jgi:hypothetical protein
MENLNASPQIALVHRASQDRKRSHPAAPDQVHLSDGADTDKSSRALLRPAEELGHLHIVGARVLGNPLKPESAYGAARIWKFSGVSWIEKRTGP